MTADNPWPSRSDQRGYDALTDTYHAHHDWSRPESLGYTLCRATAAITGRDATSMPVLSDIVDPDALEALFGNRQRSGQPTDAVTLTHDGCVIHVQRNGHILIRLPDR